SVVCHFCRESGPFIRQISMVRVSSSAIVPRSPSSKTNSCFTGHWPDPITTLTVTFDTSTPQTLTANRGMRAIFGGIINPPIMCLCKGTAENLEWSSWRAPDLSRGSRLFLPALLENAVDRGFAHSQHARNFYKRFAVSFESRNFARIAGRAWSATDPATCPCPLQPSNSALTQADTL